MKKKTVLAKLISAAMPPLWSVSCGVVAIVLALADFTCMLELANMAFDSDGLVGLFLALSVTAGTIVLPMMSGKFLHAYVAADGHRDRVKLALSATFALGFLSVVCGVYWFRIYFEHQNDLLMIAASSGGSMGATAPSGEAFPKAVLLCVLMVATGVVSFGRSYWNVEGSSDAIAALKAYRKQRVLWELEGERAAERVMEGEATLMERERHAVDGVTKARVRLTSDLLALMTVIDPAQAPAVGRVLARLADREAVVSPHGNEGSPDTRLEGTRRAA